VALDSGHALALAEIFWPTFVREGEATFVRSLRADARQALDSFESALDAEAFVNHLHVLDLLRHSASLPDEPWWDSEHADFVNACRLGVLLCEAWTAKLRADFPEEDFAVFYTQQDNPVVRFHRIRADGQLWLDPGNSRPMFDSGAALLLTSLSGRRFGAV
jgi:hypothetical protein